MIIRGISRIIGAVSVLMLLFSSLCYAQGKDDSFFGKVEYREDNHKLYPVEGASVTIVSKTDSLTAVTDFDGFFSIPGVKPGVYSVTVSHAAFQEYKISHYEIPASYSVTFLLEREELQAAIAKAEVKVFEFRLDTLVYNVAATQMISEDEMLGDILATLPGVEVKDGTFSVMGEPIKKVYINDKLIFGDSPSAAYNYLAGSEVVTVKVYDQETVENRRLGRKGKKERVMDVKTKHDIDHVLVAQAASSYGRNLERTGDGTDNRYHTGLGANYFSERTLLSTNLYLGNMGRKENQLTSVTDISSVSGTYSRIGYAGVSFIRKFGDVELGSSVQGSYSYNQNKTVSQSSSDRQYIEDGSLTDWFFSSANKSTSRTGVHTITVNSNVARRFVPSVSASISFSNDTSIVTALQKDNYHGRISTVDKLSTTSGRDWKSVLSLYKGISLGEKFTLTTEITANAGFSRGLDFQKDVSSTQTSSFISEPEGRSLRVDTRFELHYRINDYKYIALEYKPVYVNGTREKLRYLNAIEEASFDPMTSESYTNNSVSHNLGLSIHEVARNPLSAGIYTFIQRQNYSFEYPSAHHVSKPFVHIAPSISKSFSKARNNIILGFSSSQNIPSVEMLSPVINNANPLNISIGNPDLKQSRNYQLQLAETIMTAKGSSYSINSSLRLTTGSLQSRYRYYADGGNMLSYTILPGASVLTWENAASPDWNASINTSYRGSIKPIRSTFTGQLNYAFSSSPVYVGDVSTRSKVSQPQAKLSLNTNFSKKYKLEISNSTSFNLTSNKVYGDVSWMDNIFKVVSTNKFSSWLFLNANYTLRSRKALEGSTTSLSTHTLNTILGSNLGTAGWELSLACYDILNSTRSFSTTQQYNYIQTRFTPVAGRFWALNIIWRFNSTKKAGAPKIDFGHNTPTLGNNYESSNYQVRY